jgi:hypothetical protein
MNQTQHTPQPSAYGPVLAEIPFGTDGRFIYDALNNFVADCKTGDGQARGATFIVLAVNSHAALVEALAGSIAVLDSFGQYQSADIGRAALKLAEEVKP